MSRIVCLGHLASTAALTGAERVLADVAAGLAARGHDVHVVVPGRWAAAARLQDAGATVHEIRLRPAWLVWHGRRPLVRTAWHWSRALLPDPAVPRLRALLSSLRPAAVLANTSTQVRGAAAARALDLPVLCYVHELVPEGARRRFLGRGLAATATRIACVSEAAAAWVRDVAPAVPLDVVPNGIARASTRAVTADDRAAARDALGLPRDAVIAGLFGQVLPDKGVFPFIEAVAAANTPGLHAVIAGPGRPEVVERVRRAGLERLGRERFTLLPAQPDASRLLAASDIVALASLVPEALPMTVLEAMAAALPVAAFRSGGVTELVDDSATGLLCDTGDVATLGAQLARLASDAALRERLGRAALARVREHFTLERQVERIAVLLESLAR